MLKSRYALLCISIIVVGCIGCAANQVNEKTKAKALQNYGYALIQEGNIRGGLQKLLEAVKLDPENADIHHELALAYRGIQEYQFSLRHFSKAVLLRPGFSEAHNNRGTVYLILGKWDLAIDCFEKAISNIAYKTPHFAYNNLGMAFFNKKDYDRAIASYLRAIELFPSYIVGYTNLGLAYEQVRRWEEAVDAYKKAIKYGPDYPTAHFNLGRLYLELGKQGEGVKELKLALELDPEGPIGRKSEKLLGGL